MLFTLAHITIAMNHNYALEFGPFFFPGPTTTLTNLLLYFSLWKARPRGSFFFSCFSTLGVLFRTLPARVKDPCILPETIRT